MKIGIIGFGSIGSRHFNNLQRHKADIAILTKRSDIAHKYCVSSWSKFSASAPYDAIFITNETVKHVSTINKCIGLKPKALFIEKPISHNTKGLDELVRKLKKSKISAWVGYNFHFFEPFIQIKKIIKNQKLGRIYFMRVAVGQDLSEWRQRDYRKCYSSKKECGGGVILDLVHDINYPSWLLGEKIYPKTCVMKKMSDLNINSEDIAESVLSTKSGTIISVHQDYLRIPYRRSLEIAGSKASLNWDSDKNTIIVSKADKKVIISKKIKNERNDMFIKEIVFFINAIKKGKYFSNLDEAVHDIKIIESLKKYAKK